MKLKAQMPKDKTEKTISGRDALTPREYPEESSALPPHLKSYQTLTYLACPYSHADAGVREERFRLCTKAAAWLIQSKHWNVFSPITHSHPLHTMGGCASDWKTWEAIDREYLHVSCRMVVLCLPGWSLSTGVGSEIRIARTLGLPILYLELIHEGKWAFVSEWQATDKALKPLVNTAAYVSPVYDFSQLGVPLETLPPPPWTPSQYKSPLNACDANKGNLIPEGMDNPKDLIGLTKPPLRLLPGPALIRLSRVMGLGAKKYGPYNWRQKKVRYTVYLEAAMRHILSALDGEEDDPESKQSHVAHAGACAMIMLDAQSTGNLIDDRPTPGVTAKLIKELTEKETLEKGAQQ